MSLQLFFDYWGASLIALAMLLLFAFGMTSVLCETLVILSRGNKPSEPAQTEEDEE